MPADIVLATINARYIHSAFGLRYLKANLGEFESRTQLLEFRLQQRPVDIAEQILARQPRIVGLGVYIWNAEASYQLAALLKRIAPGITLVLGGPEVSFEQAAQPICQLADHVISGPAEAGFYRLCSALLNGRAAGQEDDGASLPQAAIHLPYYLYTDEDIANRVIYVEASRGCPFKCSFCLSALDKTAWGFPLSDFLQEMEQLFLRGARHFKFVDRTFNLKTAASISILEFFLGCLERLEGDDPLFLHFEVIPDRLPDELKQVIARFPPGCLQFEVGVQSFNPRVQAIIQRKQDNAASVANLAWLTGHSPAHIHSDLIFGLPGDTLVSIADSFDRLVALAPDEIQLGILKRLRGMPMLEQAAQYGLVFSPVAPYEILSTGEIDFATLQRLKRLARYWDLVANSGRFRSSLGLLLGEAPFARFMALSDWLYQTTGQTHRINLERLFGLLYAGMQAALSINREAAADALARDYARSGLKGAPRFLCATDAGERQGRASRGGNTRQRRHAD